MHLTNLSLVLGLSTVLTMNAAAQELTAIRAGRLVDVERGTVLLNQVVLIRGERVEAVQPASMQFPVVPGSSISPPTP